MRLLAIDPGSEHSGFVLYDTATQRPLEFGKPPNDLILGLIDTVTADVLAVEMIASYGMAVGAEVFETCVWIGRFIERWKHTDSLYKEHAVEQVYRSEVKLHLCNSARAKDANVRQALIDRYGGKDKAIGKKATPGPLYGLSGDCWSALGVAVTVAERDRMQVAA
jgi:hypothetical protein